MKLELASVKRVLIVSAMTHAARLTSRGGGLNNVTDSWEVFDAAAFAAYLRELANTVEQAEAAGNSIPMDTSRK